jgi:hypothetical protein
MRSLKKFLVVIRIMGEVGEKTFPPLAGLPAVGRHQNIDNNYVEDKSLSFTNICRVRA